MDTASRRRPLASLGRILALVTAACAVVGCDQAAAATSDTRATALPASELPPQLLPLAELLGEWHCQFHHEAGHVAPARDVRQRLTVTYEPAERRIASRIAPEAAGDPGSPITSTTYWSYDEAQSRFVGSAVVGTGEARSVASKTSAGWQGKRLVWNGELRSVITLSTRDTFEREEGGALTITAEVSPPGEEQWSRALVASCRR